MKYRSSFNKWQYPGGSIKRQFAGKVQGRAASIIQRAFRNRLKPSLMRPRYTQPSLRMRKDRLLASKRNYKASSRKNKFNKRFGGVARNISRYRRNMM